VLQSTSTWTTHRRPVLSRVRSPSDSLYSDARSDDWAGRRHYTTVIPSMLLEHCVTRATPSFQSISAVKSAAIARAVSLSCRRRRSRTAEQLQRRRRRRHDKGRRSLRPMSLTAIYTTLWSAPRRRRRRNHRRHHSQQQQPCLLRDVWVVSRHVSLSQPTTTPSYHILGDLLAFLIQSLGEMTSRRQGNESTTFWQRSGGQSDPGESGNRIWFRNHFWLRTDALVEICSLHTPLQAIRSISK